jgi:hypothetical protein
LANKKSAISSDTVPWVKVPLIEYLGFDVIPYCVLPSLQVIYTGENIYVNFEWLVYRLRLNMVLSREKKYFDLVSNGRGSSRALFIVKKLNEIFGNEKVKTRMYN